MTANPTDATLAVDRLPLEAFVHGAGAAQRREALKKLIGSKFLPKNCDHPLILAGRQRLIAEATQLDEPVAALFAVGQLGKLMQVVSRWAADIMIALGPALARELPPLALLDDVDDRLNVARVCGQCEEPWLAAYLARSIAQEEQGEKTRAALVEAFFRRVPSLSSGLLLLGREFAQLQPSTASKADTLAKRLERTLLAFRSVVVECDCVAGEKLGSALHGLVVDVVGAFGPPQTQATRVALSSAVVLTVHDIVRTRMSEVVRPEMYLAVGTCRRLFDRSLWPQDLQGELEKLAADISEALVLLGRQGVRDQQLLDQLLMLFNDSESGKSRIRALASLHPEFSEQVRDWLEHGRVRELQDASAATLAVSAARADSSIGVALDAVRRARHLTEGLRQRLTATLQVYEPALVGATVEWCDLVVAAAIQVEQAAALRDLQLLGVAGEEIEVSIKYFDAVGAQPRQRMVVRQPAVVRRRSDGSAGDVVLKGIVE